MRAHSATDFENLLSTDQIGFQEASERLAILLGSIVGRVQKSTVDLVVPFQCSGVDLKSFFPIVGHWVRLPPFPVFLLRIQRDDCRAASALTCCHLASSFFPLPWFLPDPTVRLGDWRKVLAAQLDPHRSQDVFFLDRL